VSAGLRLRRGDRTRQVSVAADGGSLTVTLDGTGHRVRRLDTSAVLPAPGGGRVTELTLAVDDRPCRALVVWTRDRITVALAGRVHVFETGDDARQAGPGAAGSGTITAPMPGKVVAVLVAAGDTVEAGQAVVVLEAMKMETTLAAEVAGKVEAVEAAVGATVDGGAVLLTITPAV